MGVDLITRTAKRLYEERHLTESARGIDKLLFRTMDDDIAAGFRLDKYISDPYGVAYREPNNGSVVRQFVPGTTELITPPVASEKTPIDESLRDATAVGLEATAGQIAAISKNIDQIMMDHVEAHNMTRWKQAIDMIRTGIFYALDANGNSIGLNIDFGRNASNDLTADFASVSVDTALVNIAQRLDATGTPKSNRCVLMGDLMLAEFSQDTDVQAKLDANTANTILMQNMMPPELMNTKGLYVVGQYRPGGAVAPFWILSFSPGIAYTGYKGATATDWVPEDEAIAFSLDDRTWNINRGVDAFDESGRVFRAVGDLVVDSFYENDPIVTFIRSQTRHMYLYGNIDHTVKLVGDNFST